MRVKPIKFDTMGVTDCDGKIVFTRFPGRGAGDDFSLGRLEDVFQALTERGCRTLVSLNEESEFEAFCGKSVFAEQVAQFAFSWTHMPIRDFQIPDSLFFETWQSVSTALLEELRQGHDVCVHCKGGIGRSGTVAALLLIDHGIQNEDAIRQVRQARKGAIETDEQEEFVRSYRR